MEEQSLGQIRLPFHSIRNITAPEDDAHGRKVYVGQVPAREVLDIPVDENVRGYLADAEGKQRRKRSNVHLDILDTLENRPEDFSVLNGGLTVVARGCTIKDKEKVVVLTRPSIINGSQTQGVLKDFFSSTSENPGVHVKVEVIVATEDNLIADISIARNNQNKVSPLSIVGRRGLLSELQKALHARDPAWTLRMSESDRRDDHIDTEKLIQVLVAITPSGLAAGLPPEAAYSGKARCLKLFQTVQNDAKEKNDAKARRLYTFWLLIAPDAWALYTKWRSHQGFGPTRLKSIEKTNGAVTRVPDGLVFPILAAHSEFCTQERGTWRIEIPEAFDDNFLIESAKAAYMQTANSTPHLMGKTKACYAQVKQAASMFRMIAGSIAR